MHRTFRTALSLVSAIMTSGIVYAQTVESGQDTLRQTVISEERLPSPTLESAPLQVIDRTSIERLGIHELNEVLKTFSGVQVKDNGGIGGLKTISVRGLGSQHTGIIYDGVVMSDAANGQIDLGKLCLDNVSGIILSIGGSDDIFRSARSYSTAGVLFLKSNSPFFNECRKTHLGVTMRTLTYDFSNWSSYGWNPSILWQQKLSQKWVMTMNADWQTSGEEYPFTLKTDSVTTRERRKNADVNILKGEINLYGNFGAGGRLSLKGYGLISEKGLPSIIKPYNPDTKERLWDRIAFAQGRYENDLSEKWSVQGQLKYQYSYNRYHDEKEVYPGGEKNDEYTQREYYGSIGAMFRPADKWSLSLAEDAFVNTLHETISDAAQPFRFSNMTALAGQYKTSSVTVTATLLGTYITEKVCASTTHSAAPDRFRLSPAASVNWKLLKRHNLHLKASYQDIYRVPTFNDLYYGEMGNSDLKPEIARGVNLGLTWNEGLIDGVWDRCTFSADGYFNKVQDKIVARPTLFVWQMRNIGKVSIIGSDVNFSSGFILPQAMSMELTAAYSYQYAVDVTDPESETYKNQIPYIPRHSGNASLSWLNPWVCVSYMLSWAGERWSSEQNTAANHLEPYMEHSINLFHDFTFRSSDLRFRVGAECRNFTDEQYETIQYYPMPGRTFRLNLKLNF